MTRKREPRRREDLEAVILDYVLEHGVAQLALRPLAQALGVSTFTLVYHFGSKEGLVAAVLATAEERQLAAARSGLAGIAARSPGAVLRLFWSWCAAPENQAFIRLIFEVYMLAMRDTTRVTGFLERAGVQPWLDAVGGALQHADLTAQDAELVATRIVAATLGLTLDLLTTGDIERTTRAMEAIAADLDRFIATLRAQTNRRKPGGDGAS